MSKYKFLRDSLVTNIHDKILKQVSEKYFTGNLIDIGCGTKPYKDLLKTIVTQHVGVDHDSCIHDISNIDLMGSAYNIPVKDGHFDSALCTAVLEHLEEPFEALKECNRVLKLGGIAIYSVPLIWHLHEEPRDFFRYTPYGIRYIMEKNGFQIIENIPLGGFWITIGQCFINYMERFNKGILRYTPIFPFFFLVVQLISKVLHKIDKAERWAWMYIIVAKKQSNETKDFTLNNG